MLTYLRIRGTPEYWSALDKSLSAAMGGGKTAQQALDDTAAAWEKITDRLGRDKQRDGLPGGHRLHAGAILASPWRARDRPGVRPAPVLCPPCPARPLQEHGQPPGE